MISFSDLLIVPRLYLDHLKNSTWCAIIVCNSHYQRYFFQFIISSIEFPVLKRTSILMIRTNGFLMVVLRHCWDQSNTGISFTYFTACTSDLVRRFFNQNFPFCTLRLMKISRKIDFLNQIKPMHDGMKIDFGNDFLIMTSLMFPISDFVISWL